MRADRITPRQALVMMEPSSVRAGAGSLWNELSPVDLTALRRAVVLDMTEALVRVGGASVSAVAEAGPPVYRLATWLPAGLDIQASPMPGESSPAIGWAVRELLARDFERVVVLTAAALPVTPRIASTALSVLEGADLAFGATPAGGIYLLGLRRAEALEAVVEALGDGVLAVRAAAERERLVSRSLERRVNLDEIETCTTLREFVAANPGITSGIRRWIDERSRCPDAPPLKSAP